MDVQFYLLLWILIIMEIGIWNLIMLKEGVV